MKDTTYIILLNYNGTDDTLECLESLQKLTCADFKIVVVDNSDKNNEFEALHRYFVDECLSFISFVEGEKNSYTNEKYILIKALQNKGFSHGNNLGLHFAMQQPGANYFWILNNDTVVLQNSLSELVQYHKRFPNTILGNKLLYYYNPNIIQAIGGSFSTQWYLCQHVAEGLDKNSLKSELKSIDYPIGASMFVNRNFVEKVGFLNEDYFLYFEELDWTERAKAIGFKVDWCETSVVYHKEGATIGSSYKESKSFFSETQLFISRKKFVKKYYSLGFKFYFSSLLLLLNRLRKGKLKLAKELIKITFNDVK
ncbi:MAG TPA: glycosyltransferase family 2 protein [Flavobacterium sp.]|nr:glycosyltransferase family 2 protein [Flavobacterium sp.]